jgi:hypothetical protein
MVKILTEMNIKIDNLTRIVQLVVNEQVPSLTLPNDINLPIDSLDELNLPNDINLPIDSLDELNRLEDNLKTDEELKKNL